MAVTPLMRCFLSALQSTVDLLFDEHLEVTTAKS